MTIEVIYIPQADEFVKNPIKPGHLVYKPF